MKPAEIFGFDSEDDGQGNPFLFTFVSGSGQWSCKTPSDALQFIGSLAEKYPDHQVELWATNLEYDLVNLFGPERIAEPSLRWGRSFLVGARWRGVEFRDTVRHLPASVEELGQLVGLKKLKRSRSLAYAIRDAAITYRSARELHRVYQTLGQHPRQTLASTALAIWRTRYFKKDIFRPLKSIWEKAGLAYYGGRTEPFAIGSYSPLSVIDVASMFPWAMRGRFPVPWGGFFPVSRNAAPEASGIYYARIDSDVKLPVLPLRTDQGLVYPNGQFSGWYVGDELIYAAKVGVGVRVIRGYEFADYCEPFNSYVQDLFELKSASRGPMRTVYKLLLNALYGKFGQKGEKVISTPVEKFKAMRKRPEDFRIWNGLAIYRKDAPPPIHSNNLWPAIVTARARVRLHQEMKKIIDRGGRVFYCDTDSVMFQGPGRYPEKAKGIGDFELRGRFKEILVVGKKEYAIRSYDGKTELHAKGIPLASRLGYLETGTASFKRPVRLLEAARAGLRANVWREVPKKRHVDFSGRSRTADGSLLPIIVSAK